MRRAASTITGSERRRATDCVVCVGFYERSAVTRKISSAHPDLVVDRCFALVLRREPRVDCSSARHDCLCPLTEDFPSELRLDPDAFASWCRSMLDIPILTKPRVVQQPRSLRRGAIELGQELASFRQVGAAEPFDEPVIDLGQQLAGCFMSALAHPQATHTD